jgi:hypothetical protein
MSRRASLRRLVRRRLPQAAGRARRSTATSPRATGRTSARTRAMSRRRPTCCPARSTSRSTASRSRPGVWVAEGAEVDPTPCSRAALHRRLRQGRGRRELREFTVLGSNVVVKEGAFLHRRSCTTTCTSARTQPARLRHRQEHRRHAPAPGSRRRGHRRRVPDRVRNRSPGRVRSTRSRPSRPARSSTPVIWESRGQRTCSARAGLRAPQRRDHPRARPSGSPARTPRP